MIHANKKEEDYMRIIKVTDYDEVSVRTANMILGQVNLKPDAVLGLATGGSPVGAYKKSWRHITITKLIFRSYDN